MDYASLHISRPRLDNSRSGFGWCGEDVMRLFSAFPSTANLPSVVQWRGPCKDFAERSKIKSFKIYSGLNLKKKKKSPFKETETTSGITVWEPPTVQRVPNLILSLFHMYIGLVGVL